MYESTLTLLSGSQGHPEIKWVSPYLTRNGNEMKSLVYCTTERLPKDRSAQTDGQTSARNTSHAANASSCNQQEAASTAWAAAEAATKQGRLPLTERWFVAQLRNQKWKGRWEDEWKAHPSLTIQPATCSNLLLEI